MITLKSPQEIQHMQRACAIVARILQDMAEEVAPGITTYDLDRLAESRIKELGAKPALKG